MLGSIRGHAHAASHAVAGVTVNRVCETIQRLTGAEALADGLGGRTDKRSDTSFCIWPRLLGGALWLHGRAKAAADASDSALTATALPLFSTMSHGLRQRLDGLAGAADDRIATAAHDSGEEGQREGRQNVNSEHQRLVHLCEGTIGIGPPVGVHQRDFGDDDAEHTRAAGELLPPPAARYFWEFGQTGVGHVCRNRKVVG